MSHTAAKRGPLSENLIIRPLQTKLVSRVSGSMTLPIYDVRMMGGICKQTSECIKEARDFRCSLLEHCEKELDYPNDIFKDVHFAEIYCDESATMEAGQRNSDSMYYATNEEGKVSKYISASHV